MIVETIDPKLLNVVTVTESAQEHLVKQLAEPSIGIRLSLKPSGCAGFAYSWELITELNKDDIALVSLNEQYSLYTNEVSKEYLLGSTIDLKDEGIKGSQLEVTSSKIVDACGCGESVRFG